MTKLEILKEKIAKLRDSDSHVCPHDQWQKLEKRLWDWEAYPCTCESYDEVIDLITEIQLVLEVY